MLHSLWVAFRGSGRPAGGALKLGARALDKTRVERVEPQPSGALCERLSESSASFLAGRGDTVLSAELREHLRGCAECSRTYRQDIFVAARIGRERRLARWEAERRHRRGALRRLALDAESRPRRFWLRTVILPGLIVFALTRAVPDSAQAQVRALEGTCAVGPGRLKPDAWPRVLRRGEWIATGDDSRARVARDEQWSVELAPGAAIVASDVERGHFLFERGHVDVDGNALIQTSVGVVEWSSANGSITRSGDELTIALERGSAMWIDASGSCELAPGERITLALGAR